MNLSGATIGSYNTVVKMNGVSKDTVKRIVQSCEDFAQKAQQKKSKTPGATIAAAPGFTIGLILTLTMSAIENLTKPDISAYIAERMGQQYKSSADDTLFQGTIMDYQIGTQSPTAGDYLGQWRKVPCSIVKFDHIYFFARFLISWVE